MIGHAPFEPVEQLASLQLISKSYPVVARKEFVHGDSSHPFEKSTVDPATVWSSDTKPWRVPQ